MAGRVLWRGAITFGLVHIPVGLHTASSESGVDFDWLDKRSMDRVGYKRVNKRTGKEISKEDIVKGVEYADGQYVIVSPEEIEAVFPRTTQTIEIERFVDATAIPFVYLERPYYIEPINKGQKVYALLRDTLSKTGKVGLAKVVIQTKQHLAVLVPSGPALVLNLLRWGDEVKTFEGLELPDEKGKGFTFSAAEKKMAEQLVKEMSGDWNPEEFKDEFKHAIMSLVEKKAKAGKAKSVIEPEETAPSQTADVIDLTELLARSLKGGQSRSAVTSKSGPSASKKPATKKPAAKSSRAAAGRTTKAKKAA